MMMGMLRIGRGAGQFDSALRLAQEAQVGTGGGGGVAGCSAEQLARLGCR